MSSQYFERTMPAVRDLEEGMNSILSLTTSLILKFKLTGKKRALGTKFGKHEAKLRQIWDKNGKSRRAFEIRDEAKRSNPQGICKNGHGKIESRIEQSP